MPIVQHNFKEIYQLQCVTEPPHDPLRESHLNAFRESGKLFDLSNKASEHLKSIEKQYSAGSLEYRAITRHIALLKTKACQYSRVNSSRLLLGRPVLEEAIAELYPTPRPHTVQIEINGQEKTIPASLVGITFDQVVNFARQYGDDLDAQRQRIDAMPAGQEKQTALILWRVDLMYKAVSFYTGVPLEVLKQSEFEDEIYAIYTMCLQGIITPANP